MSDSQCTKWDIHVLGETRRGITAVAAATTWPIGYVLDWLWRDKTGGIPLPVDDWRQQMKNERSKG